MSKHSEIKALLELIEDPDQLVFESITKKFMDFGDEVVPALEDYRHVSSDEELIQKISHILSSISLAKLERSLEYWKSAEEQSTLEASIIVAEYLNRENEKDAFIREIEKMRKSIWLELNDYLTPLEEINIFNKVILGHYKLRGEDTQYEQAAHFDPMQLLEVKQANTFPMASIYLIMGEMLGLPIRPARIPKQNLLCYVNEDQFLNEDGEDAIIFFVDPLNGQVYSVTDVENYLKKIDYIPHPMTMKASPTRDFVKNWLLEIAKLEKAAERIFCQKEIIRIAGSLDTGW
ncbi:MAG: transglutaminase family protein [Bacteroidota bacterium]